MGGEIAIDLPELAGFVRGIGVDPKFRTKAEVFLRAHQDHMVVRKLRMNRPLTHSDLAELERILVESGIGTAEDVQRASEESRGLGLFVRGLVGLDREAAKDALAGFLVGKVLTANQIEFVSMIVDHLTAHGVIEAARLYESPFTDLTPRGPDGLFSASEVDALVAVIDSVRAAAVAA